MPDINQQQNFVMAGQNTVYPGMQQAPEAFPSFQQTGAGDMSQMAPSINIEYAPTARQNSFEPPKPPMDQDSLTPPERGKEYGTGVDRATTD